MRERERREPIVFIQHFVFLSHIIDRHLANAFLLMCQIGACCIYVVFMAKNIKSIVDYATDSDTDVRLFMVIILLPIIFLNWVNKSSYFAYVLN